MSRWSSDRSGLAWLLAAWVAAGAESAPAADAVLVSCRRIWAEAPHCAFTDLIRRRDAWFCVFREGRQHVSADGAIRVIRSADGGAWQSAAVLRSEAGDLRDPKIVEEPGGRLMLTAALAGLAGAQARHQTRVWFSEDGSHWSEPVDIGEPNVWLWRVTWHGREAFGIGYDTVDEAFVRLYRSADGRRFDPLVSELRTEGRPNESAIVFQPDGSAVCLLRRDGPSAGGLLGTASAPYMRWEWHDLGARIGGPQMLRLPDGRILAAVRLYDGGARTSLAWIHPSSARMEECLRLPSGGDTSYAGLQWNDGLVWVSYYSSHEGSAAIYLARVRFH